MPLGHIINIGSGTDHGVHQARLCTDSDMRPLSRSAIGCPSWSDASWGLVPGLFFGRAGRCDQRGIDHAAGFEQGPFGSHVGQAKPLLQTMNALHHCKIKRWAACLGQRRVWSDQCQQFTLRHDLLRPVKQDLFAR